MNHVHEKVMIGLQPGILRRNVLHHDAHWDPDDFWTSMPCWALAGQGRGSLDWLSVVVVVKSRGPVVDGGRTCAATLRLPCSPNAVISSKHSHGHPSRRVRESRKKSGEIWIMTSISRLNLKLQSLELRPSAAKRSERLQQNSHHRATSGRGKPRLTAVEVGCQSWQGWVGSRPSMLGI